MQLLEAIVTEAREILSACQAASELSDVRLRYLEVQIDKPTATRLWQAIAALDETKPAEPPEASQ